MKKLVLLFLNIGKGVAASFILFLMLVGFSSCKEDVIYEPFPLRIDIMIIDENGDNLLDENADGNWVGQPFTILKIDEEYKQGRTYELFWWNLEYPNIPHSRMILLSGFTVEPLRYLVDGDIEELEGQYFLRFEGSYKTENKEYSLLFKVPGSEEEYIIYVKHSYNKRKDKSNTKITFNGEPIEDLPIKIVLPRRLDTQSE